MSQTARLESEPAWMYFTGKGMICASFGLLGRLFEKTALCDFAHGRLIDGRCICYDGYHVYRCNATYVSVNSGDFGEISRRRLPVMQSRFALSGLSLCLIMIIPLWISVFIRMIASFQEKEASHFQRMANERLMREQQRRLCERRAAAIQVPRTSRNRAVCEFRYFMQAARNADVRLLTGVCGLHSPRF
uniref:Uncharacterized protein n=1 Tax=Ascaris lumbricoides TaxID=6252 RepID=A0A9J2P6Y4_ASCLU